MDIEKVVEVEEGAVDPVDIDVDFILGDFELPIHEPPSPISLPSRKRQRNRADPISAEVERYLKAPTAAWNILVPLGQTPDPQVLADCATFIGMSTSEEMSASFNALHFDEIKAISESVLS